MVRTSLLVLAALAVAAPSLATSPGDRGEVVADAVPHYRIVEPGLGDLCDQNDPDDGFDFETGFDFDICQPKWLTPPVRVLLTTITHEVSRMVCSNQSNPIVICREMTPIDDPSGPRFTASECGDPTATCVQLDGSADGVFFGRGLVVTALLEFEIEGERYTIGQSFVQNPGATEVKVGHWNEFDSEVAVDADGPIQAEQFSVIAVPVQSQNPLQIRLREIAKAKFGTDGIPVLVTGDGKGVLALEDGDTVSPDALGTPAADVASNPLATVTRSRLTLRFAEPNPDGAVPNF